MEVMTCKKCLHQMNMTKVFFVCVCAKVKCNSSPIHLEQLDSTFFLYAFFFFFLSCCFNKAFFFFFLMKSQTCQTASKQTSHSFIHQTFYLKKQKEKQTSLVFRLFRSNDDWEAAPQSSRNSSLVAIKMPKARQHEWTICPQQVGNWLLNHIK